ncbi:MAG: response regulator transcription factor [Clostridia bacterium]|nr:response regulator transcription factor [Clostridia bacterium]
MYKILVVDDEEKIRELIGKYAKFDGHSVDFATDGMEAVEKCRENTYDAVIMDIMMPNLDGFSACREIRKKSEVPIIMLSARGEEYDKINGFEIGVDDYVVKPFSPRELMLRVEAILKRSQKAEPEAKAEIYKSEGLEVNFTARRVYVDGSEVNLSPKEYDLLFFMIKNKDIALTRETLINKVWGYDFFGGDRTLDTHIKLLRKSLGDYNKYIVTLRGVGYRYSDEH